MLEIQIQTHMHTHNGSFIWVTPKTNLEMSFQAQVVPCVMYRKYSRGMGNGGRKVDGSYRVYLLNQQLLLATRVQSWWETLGNAWLKVIPPRDEDTGVFINHHWLKAAGGMLISKYMKLGTQVGKVACGSWTYTQCSS